MLICVRILSAVVSPNGLEQPHLAPPPHSSHLPMGPGAPFKLSPGLSLLLELCWRNAWLWLLLVLADEVPSLLDVLYSLALSPPSLREQLDLADKPK